MDSLLPCKRKRETEKEEEILPKVLLPSEILMFEILSRVEVQSLIQFRCVSKSWDKLVTDPFFVTMHMNRSLENNSFKAKLMIIDNNHKLYSLDFERGLGYVVAIEHPVSASRIRVCGSCNGLLCMLFDHDLYIWNPCTRMCRKVPYLPPNYDGKKIIGYGLGYNSVVDDYVVVRVSSSSHNNFEDEFTSTVDVYSLQRDSSRTLPDHIPYELWHDKSGVFIEGSLHWIGLVHRESRLHKNQVIIIAFDIVSEKFREVPLPQILYGESRPSIKDINIAESAGQLLMRCWLRGDCEVSVWVMKIYGVKESWTKLFNIPNDLDSRSLFCLKRNGSVVLLLFNIPDDLDRRSLFCSKRNGSVVLQTRLNMDIIILHDPKTKLQTYPCIQGPCGVAEAITYVESLVRV